MSNIPFVNNLIQWIYMDFKVQTEQFEGPISLLLELIEKRKMPINDISLISITDDYIRYIQELGSISLSNKTYFIFIASTLTLIKSKSLLPTLELTDNEEGDIDALKKRIEVFREYQLAAENLKIHFQRKHTLFYQKSSKRKIYFQPYDTISKNNLFEVIKSVFHEIPEKPATKKEGYIKIAVHIDQMMNFLEKRISETLKIDFESFILPFTKENNEPKQIRIYRVVGFLAMLELVKKGTFDILQKTNFSTIEIEKI